MNVFPFVTFACSFSVLRSYVCGCIVYALYYLLSVCNECVCAAVSLIAVRPKIDSDAVHTTYMWNSAFTRAEVR